MAKFGFKRLVVGAAVALPLLATQLIGAPAASAAPLAVRTITYNVGQAGTYASTVDQAVKIWDDKVANIVVKKVSGSANVTFYATNTGGSRALTTSLGNGKVWIDSTQVNQGYSKLRIAAHEFGHILGLPDHYSGPCSELMSGGGPGTSCTNPYPNSTEVNKVNKAFSHGFVGVAPAGAVDSPPYVR